MPRADGQARWAVDGPEKNRQATAGALVIGLILVIAALVAIVPVAARLASTPPSESSEWSAGTVPAAETPGAGTGSLPSTTRIPSTVTPATEPVLQGPSTPTTSTIAETPPPPCTANMGETLLEGRAKPSTGGDQPRPPTDWTPPLQQGFDWDQDGTQDQLRIEDGTVTIAWSTGTLVINGVITSLASVQDRNGTTFNASERHPVPAAVGDVTGDGWLDLLVANSGTISVLAGSGAADAGEVSFWDIGTTTLGWTSEPISILDTPRGLVPWPNSTVSVLWDFTGDGVNDFLASGALDRSSGPQIYYSGTPCWTSR